MGDDKGMALGGCTATGCDKELASGIHLCHQDTTRLEEALRDVPAACSNIHTTACKLDVGAGSVGGTGCAASGSEPANLDALDKAQTLSVILGGWASHLPVLQPTGDAPAVAGWLVAQLDRIRRQDWAGDFLQELRDALNDCNRATDRAGQRVFAGMCPTQNEATVCGEPLYALTGRPYIICRTCGQEWDVTDWRERALTAAELHTGTAAEISRMLSDPVTREALPQTRIRQWVRRGKLTACGEDDNGRPIYQVSEVRNLWATMQASTYNRARLAA